MPLDEHIEGSHGECQARLKIGPAPVHDLFAMTDQRQHREHRLDKHPVLPRAALAQFEIGGIAPGRMEAGITQNNHTLLKLPNEPLKRVIRHIDRGTRPPHDQPPLIEEQTEFAPDNPAMVRHAFAADLLGTVAFAHGVNQLDAVGVNDPKHGRSGQEDLGPVLMGLQQTKEPRPLGEAGKQRPIVAGQPPIKRPVADTFEGMQVRQVA